MKTLIINLLTENGYTEKSYNHFYKNNKDITVKDTQVYGCINGMEVFFIKYSDLTDDYFETIKTKLTKKGFL